MEPIMEYLPNGLTLNIPDRAFPLSTDSMALASFVRLPRNARVLDLGSGCGTLGLLLCASDPGCHVTGIELDSLAHEAALENIRRNNLSSRMNSICADLRNITGLFASGSFDLCISNPPYFSSGGISSSLPQARQELQCSLSDLIASAGRLLKYGGDLYLVHKPERLGEIIALGAAQKLETKRLLLLRHWEGSPVSLILLQLRKGAKPGLKIHEAALFDSTGNPTSYHTSVYHTE